MIATSLTGSPFDTGRQPYQDFHLLTGLRNDLVHHKPETVREALVEHEGSILTIPEALHSRIKSLVSRGIISEPDPKVFWSLVGILERPSVARWAFDAAKQMIRAVANCFPSPSYRQWLLDSQSALKEKGTNSENS